MVLLPERQGRVGNTIGEIRCQLLGESCHTLNPETDHNDLSLYCTGICLCVG